jgi:hypothetical protein
MDIYEKIDEKKLGRPKKPVRGIKIEDLDEMPGSLSMQEAALLLGCDRTTLYRQARAGKFPPAFMTAGSMRGDPQKLARYIRSGSLSSAGDDQEKRAA